jgi:hypothetical protein
VKAFENVADLKVLLRVLVDVVRREEGGGEKEKEKDKEKESDHRVGTMDEKRLHELVQVTGSLLNHDHAHGSSSRRDRYLPGNLTLCYMHFQGGHKRVAVSWGLVLRHLYGRYLQLRRPHEEKRERLFIVKFGYTDVMYVDENLSLREVGTLGAAPFADVRGLTIHNEQNRDNPLQLLWYVFCCTIVLPSFLVCDVSYPSIAPCLHSLTRHDTSLTIIPFSPQSIINRHNTHLLITLQVHERAPQISSRRRSGG